MNEMARPRNSQEKLKLQLRTVALMNLLRIRVGAENPSQFSEWVNQKSESLGWPDMKESNKWYKYFRGDISQDPLRALNRLKELFPDVFNIFYDGPGRLWTALWSDDSDELWQICNYHDIAYGCQPDNETIELVGREPFFQDATYNFECSLLTNRVLGQALDLRDLSESIALYRIHMEINKKTRTDETAPYRCVKFCLGSKEIIETLINLGIYDYIQDYLKNVEIGRLESELCYRKAIGNINIMTYADNPFSAHTVDQIMSQLHIGV
jgi:hypothetical protein